MYAAIWPLSVETNSFRSMSATIETQLRQRLHLKSKMFYPLSFKENICHSEKPSLQKFDVISMVSLFLNVWLINDSVIGLK